MSGGVLRVLRQGIGLPLTYPISSRDETILSERQARGLAQVGLFLMTIAYAGYVRSFAMFR